MKNDTNNLKKYILSCFLLLFLVTGWSQTNQIELLITRDQQNVPIFIKAKDNKLISPIKATNSRSNTPMAIATHFLAENKELLQLSNPTEEFKEKEVIVDKQGNKHIKIQQYLNNIPIWNSQAIVHANNRGVYAFNGRYHATPELRAETATISKKKAEEIVENYLGKEKFSLSAALKHLLSDTEKQQPALMYYHDPLLNTFELAWKVKFHTADHENWLFMIDALNGEILKKLNKSCSFAGPTTARATDLNGITQTIGTYDDDDGYLLVDASKPMFVPNLFEPNNPDGKGTIATFTGQFSNLLGDFRLINSPNNTWVDPAAVSAHNHAGISYDYFYNTFGRNSIDGQGGNIISVVNTAIKNNAIWNGDLNLMIYGQGDVDFLQEVSFANSLDVAAHEMTHGVVENSVDLPYEFQSGALDESFADIFGVMVDRDDWTLGEDIVNPAIFLSGSMRNLKNPNNGLRNGQSGWQPRHMSEFQTTDRDNGGVHINSGIPNHAFYLFAETSGIGKEIAEQVYYKALTQHLPANARFIDCREAVILAAQEFSNNPSVANAAAAAFDAVGIFDASTHNSRNTVSLTDIRIDATYENIGVLVEISGDENQNSALFIRYRPVGAENYERGLPTLRSHPSMEVAGGRLNKNHHAGSALFLEPNTVYELRLVLIDVDGGTTVRLETVKTKAAMPTNNGTSYYVVPGNGGGTGSINNPFRGLQTAADRAKPGATFIVKDGIYQPFTLNTSGTASKPIIFKSKNRHSAIIDGGNTNRGIINIGNFDQVTKYIIIDGFTVKNGAWGINAENTAFLTVRNNKVYEVEYGFNNRREKGLEQDQTIENNSFTGRSNTTRPGIDIRGNNNVVRYNTIKHFGDGVSTDGRAYETSFSMDIHNNDISDIVADAIEVDYTVANTRIYGNRCSNSRIGISLTPIYGGPCYVLQNELLVDTPFKMQEDGFGVLFGTNSLSFSAPTTSTAAAVATDNSIIPEEPLDEELTPLLVAPQLEVMPNPIQEIATIRFYLPEVATTSVSVYVFDANGQLLQEQRVESTQGWQTTQLNASDFPMGMYYVVLQTPQRRVMKKVVVVK